MKHILIALCLFLLAPQILQSQVFYVRPGGSGGSYLFQQQSGAENFLSTGFAEHNFTAVSRDSRFVVFSSPDPVTAGLQVPPSSDVYIFDRVFGQTRKVIDNSTNIQQNVPTQGSIQTQTFRPLSAALSPNNQFLAYGLELTLREGTANPQVGRVLIVASPANGTTLFSPTDARGGALSDGTAGEFLGLSWDPGGGSFVTPILTPVGTTSLPAIRRVSHNGSGQWNIGSALSSPFYSAPQAQCQVYPAISHSGGRLAYFDLFFPNFLASGLVQARLVVANANGSNAQVIVNFNQGFYPTGLAWSRDGKQLVFGIGQQVQFGSVVSNLVDPATAVIRQTPSGGGAVTQVAGIGDKRAFFPSVSAVSLVSDQYYEQANAMYAYFASKGDQKSGLAFWFYYRAYGDQALRTAQGNTALAQKEFYLGLAYFYYTYLTGSSAAYYYYLYIGYSELTYYLALGDSATASAYYNFYTALALSVL